jgi:hypothetical protein
MLLSSLGSKKNPSKNQHEAGSKLRLLHAAFFFGLFFDLKDGGDMFL